MDTEITIRITDLIAEPVGSPEIICGNSGYTVQIEFDDAWRFYLLKTVRFEWLDTQTGQKRHRDVQYAGGQIPIPTEATQDVYELNIGAYAGNLMSSTAARIPCQRCVTDGATYHGDPESPDTYAELLDAIEHMPTGKSSPEIMRPVIRDGMEAGYYETLTVPPQMLMLSMLAMAPPENDEPTEEEENNG